VRVCLLNSLPEYRELESALQTLRFPVNSGAQTL
jgi:hypothetical protein